MAGNTPVLPDLRSGAIATCIGEAPGADEERTGTPFVGRSGKELEKTLSATGLTRFDVGLDNALLCLDGGTEVRLADGSRLRIGGMVKEQHPGPVLSVDASGKIVSRRVVGWFKNPRGNRRLIKLTTKHAKGNKWGVVGPYLTEDHPVLSHDGYIPAGESSGRKIATGELEPSGTALRIALASLLGDGSIRNHSSYLRITHAEDQWDYLRLKAMALSDLGVKIAPIAKQPGNVQRQRAAATQSLTWVRQMRKLFFRDGQKRIPSIVFDHFDDLLLAVWYFDDGHLRERGGGRRPHAEICATTIHRGDLERMARELRRRGMDCKVRDPGRIVFSVVGTVELSRRVRQYRPPSMGKKLIPEHRHGSFNLATYSPVSALNYDIARVRRPGRKVNDTVYCIEVEETNNFLMAPLGVAHNCRPPGNELKRFLARLSKANKARKERGEATVPTPMECCWPHLERTIAQSKALIVLGATALTVIRRHLTVELKPGEPEEKGTGDKGLMRLRGFPLWLDFRGRKIPMVATVHPAHVLRKRRWTSTLQADVAKGIRHATGRLQWRDPEIIYDPSPEQLINVLSSFAHQIVGVDIETDDKEPLACRLRSVGFATEKLGIVAGFDSVEYGKGWHHWRCHPEVSRRIIAEFLQRDDILVTGNNINVFDRQKLEVERMPLPDFKSVFDNTVAHHVTDPEFPHGLDFLMSRLTDSPKHKAVKDHKTGWTSDRKLHLYNGLDCVGSAILTPYLANRLRELNLGHVYLSDVTRMQRLAVGMHKVGMWVDPSELKRHKIRLTLALNEAAGRAFAALGYIINLDSHEQVKRAFFSESGFQLPVTSVETDGGEPSVNKDAVYELVQRGLPRRARRFMEALLDYRRNKKLLSTYVTVRGPNNKKGLLIWPDGRVHSTYNPHSNLAGRCNSSGPNMFNVPDTKIDPDSLRSMYAAEEGNVYAAADLAQAHLRIIAVRAGISRWLDVFNSPPEKQKKFTRYDLHSVNASMFFDKTPSSIQKFERDFAKTMIYLLVYDGQPPTAHQLMQRVRNPKTGERPYSDLPLLDVQRMRDRLLKEEPALEEWWTEEVAGWRKNGRVFDMVMGRQNTLLDLSEGKEDRSKIVNHPILATEAAIMAGCIERVVDQVGWNFETTGARGLGGPGVTHYNYDSLLCEIPLRNGPKAQAILEETMTTTLSYRGREVLIPAESQIGQRWSEV